MNDATLNLFRDLADAMNPGAKDWEWTGRFISQRMFGITEAKAKAMAARYGGIAQRAPRLCERGPVLQGNGVPDCCADCLAESCQNPRRCAKAGNCICGE